jgi:hypothetical protein
MKKTLILLIISVSQILTSCEKGGNCFNTEGNLKKEVRESGKIFKNLILSNDVNLFLSPGQPSVSVEAGEHLIDLVKAEVDQDQFLHLKDKNTCKWFGKYKAVTNAYVTLNELWQFTSYGLANITFTDTLNLEYIKAEFYQAGGKARLLLNSDVIVLSHFAGVTDVFAAGHTNRLILQSDDRAVLDCRNLKAVNARITSKGTGNMFVNVTDSMEIRMSGIGNIYYTGDPDVIDIKEMSGSGRLIKL